MNKNNRRMDRLDALEARLSGPKRIALLAIATWVRPRCWRCFTARPPAAGFPACGWRPPTRRAPSTWRRRSRQLESGQPMAGSLAETELKLRLYHGPARFDLIVKDYQGEHVTLGSEEPIQEFFADCDAVLLCLDPEGSAEPAERTAPAAGSRKPAGALYRSLRRPEHGPAGRPVIDQVRPGAGQQRGKRRESRNRRGASRPSLSSDWSTSDMG